jgi:HEAT repeat protein
MGGSLEINLWDIVCRVAELNENECLRLQKADEATEQKVATEKDLQILEQAHEKFSKKFRAESNKKALSAQAKRLLKVDPDFVNEWLNLYHFHKTLKQANEDSQGHTEKVASQIRTGPLNGPSQKDEANPEFMKSLSADDIKALVPELIKALKDSEETREYARQALKKLGPEEKAQVRRLLRELKFEMEVRPVGIDTIFKAGIKGMKKAGRFVIFTIAKGLENDDPKVRYRAAGALGKMGPAAKDAVPLLIKRLNRKDERMMYVRRAAAWALGKIGPAAQSAIEALEHMAKHDRWGYCRETAQKALRKIKGQSKPADISGRRVLPAKSNHTRIGSFILEEDFQGKSIRRTLRLLEEPIGRGHPPPWFWEPWMEPMPMFVNYLNYYWWTNMIMAR